MADTGLGFAVYARGSDGKPEKLAEFKDAADARAFEVSKRRYGGEAKTFASGASSKRVKAAFPTAAQEPPTNSALEVRLSHARGQAQEEALIKELQSAVADDVDTSEAKEAIEASEEAKDKAEAEAEGTSSEPATT